MSISSCTAFPFIATLVGGTEAAPQRLGEACNPDRNRTTEFPLGSTYQFNLDRILSSLSADSTKRSGGFGNSTAGDGRNSSGNAVYGLYLCRGDVAADVCQDCVATASRDILRKCGRVRSAIIWYDLCMLRYSAQSFFSTLSTDPNVVLRNSENANKIDEYEKLLADALKNVKTRVLSGRSSPEMFAAIEMESTGLPPTYVLAQCTPDLTSENCDLCLQTASQALQISDYQKPGGKVLMPSCNIRYELYPFYNQTAAANTMAPPPPDPDELADRIKRLQLDWPRRYKIIGGIARGILYLHEDSRLKIIHRDLKASNVLLDGNMNPKISDFGLARLFNVNQTKGNTNKIVGTYGYMSPEYAIHGRFSVKSDVFSFGALVLETISGKKNSNFYLSDAAQDLLSYAWKLWRDGTPLRLMDQTLGETYTRNEVIRCIHISLLCVQDDEAERPTMATVVHLLNSTSLSLPVPKQPAFFVRNGAGLDYRMKGQKIEHSSKPMQCSINEVSISELDPR